jgi:hypothetical protein
LSLSNTAIGELYRSLSSSDIKKLTKYIQHQYESPENRVSKLHRAILQIILSKTEDKSDLSQLKKMAYKKEKISHSNWTSQISILQNIIKEFVILKEAKAKNIYTETLWGEYLIEKGLKKNLTVKLSNFKVDQKNDDYPVLKKYIRDRELVILNHLIYTKKNKRHYEDMLSELYSFQDFVAERKMNIVSSILTYPENKVAIDLDYKEIQSLLEYGKQSSNELVQLNAYNLALVVYKDFESFIALRTKLNQIIDSIPISSAIETSIMLINFGLNQLDNGVLNFLEGTFQVFETLVERDIFNSKLFFNHTFFNRYITMRLRVLNETQETMEILMEKIDLLPLIQRDSCLNLNLAKILFKEKKYHDSIQSLAKINVSKSLFYLPLTKTLLLKNLVEIEDEERVKAEKENLYKYYFYSKSLSLEAKNRYKLFHSYIGDLLTLRFEQFSRQKRSKLSKAIGNTSPYFIEKEWMQERFKFLQDQYRMKAKNKG